MSLEPNNEEHLADVIYPLQFLSAPINNVKLSESEPLQDTPVVPEVIRHQSRPRIIGRIALRCAAGAAVLAATPLTAIAAAEYGPSTHTSAAGLGATSHVKIMHDTSTLDLGVFGAIRLPKHENVLGLNLGLDARIDGSQLDLNDPTERAATGQILNRPDPVMDRIIRETTRDTLENVAVAGGTMLAFEMIAGGLLIARRRNYGAHGEKLVTGQKGFNRWESRILTGLGAAIILVPSVLGAHPLTHPEHSAVVADPALENTALHGAELDGIIKNSAPTLISLMQNTEKFDEQTAKDTAELVASRPDLLPKEGWTYFLQADDLQDRSGMARQLGLLAKLLGVKFITMTGDWSTITQFGFGSYLMDSVRYESGDIPTLTDDGNHDTKQTEQYEKLAGFTVADNKTHVVNGIPILSLNSIDVSTLSPDGLASVLRDPEVDAATAIANAVEEIKDTSPQIVFVHDHNEATAIAEAAIKAGYPVPLIITGRSFEQVGPKTVTVKGFEGSTVIFTAGSSGGHHDTSVQFGNIQVDSPINLFARNDTTGEVKYITFMYHPSGPPTVAENMTQIVLPKNGSTLSSEAVPKKSEAPSTKSATAQ